MYFAKSCNFCLHKSTTAKFYPCTESDKDLVEKIYEGMVGGLTIEFTRKADVDKTFIRDPTNWCNSLAGFDASQPYPFVLSRLSQAMATGTVQGMGTRF